MKVNRGEGRACSVRYVCLGPWTSLDRGSGRIGHLGLELGWGEGALLNNKAEEVWRVGRV